MTTVTLASDFIERIRSHHEDREEHEVEGQEDYFLGGVSSPLLNHTRGSFVSFVVNSTFHLVAALPGFGSRLTPG